MSKGFKDLYNVAVSSNISDSISPFISTGEITCVVLSENNNIYKGINIIEDNKQILESAKTHNVNYILIDDKYEVNIDLD